MHGAVRGAGFGVVLGAVLGAVIGAILGGVLGAVRGAVLGPVLGAAREAVLGSVLGAVLRAALGAVLGSLLGPSLLILSIIAGGRGARARCPTRGFTSPRSHGVEATPPAPTLSGAEAPRWRRSSERSPRALGDGPAESPRR